MYKKEKFPFAMTKKSLVAYIIFTVLMGLFLFFIRGDMEGKLAACIVCPILILYFSIHTVRKEKQMLKLMKQKYSLLLVIILKVLNGMRNM